MRHEACQERASFVLFKVLDLQLSFVFRDVVGFLNFARQLDTFTVYLIDVIVGERVDPTGPLACL